MHDYQREFIDFAIARGVLCFGEFTLKSGRISPYFFNSGLFNDGDSLCQLGRYYRQAIDESGIDFDMLFGHRRDVDGYADALEYFDKRLPELLEAMNEDDVLFICADHGCDPTWEGTDHTREHIPVIAYGKGIIPGALGKRETFADIGQTVAAYFDLPPTEFGTSFLSG